MHLSVMSIAVFGNGFSFKTFFQHVEQTALPVMKLHVLPFSFLKLVWGLGCLTPLSTGAPTYTTTHKNKTVNVDHLLYWYFQQNQSLNIKKHDVHSNARGAPGQLPNVTMR